MFKNLSHSSSLSFPLNLIRNSHNLSGRRCIVYSVYLLLLLLLTRQSYKKLKACCMRYFVLLKKLPSPCFPFTQHYCSDSSVCVLGSISCLVTQVRHKHILSSEREILSKYERERFSQMHYRREREPANERETRRARRGRKRASVVLKLELAPSTIESDRSAIEGRGKT